jgi:NAD(P)-dependent dehydrogenase (short-subunit alcohol dehydrogenase family)
VSRPHAVIVGGTKGVGRELAGLLAADGQRVTVVGRSAAAFDHPEIVGLAGDAEDPETLLTRLQKHVADHRPISTLVFLQRYRGSGDSWAGELTVAMTATKTLIDGLVPHFASDGNRAICIVTSNAASFVARNQSLGYHTSKAALRQMARFYAVKLGPQGIRVNVVSPCTFIKPESAAYYAGQTELQKLYAQITPLARMGTAREVAQAVAFLCGPQASFITGQDLAVDGGLSLMLQDAMAREIARLAG